MLTAMYLLAAFIAGVTVATLYARYDGKKGKFTCLNTACPIRQPLKSNPVAGRVL